MTMKDREKLIVEQFNASTEKMDKKNLKHMLKDLETAYKKADRKKLFELSTYFKEVSDCLGDDEETVLKENLDSINAEIEKNGASALNIARAKNTKAKLSIVKYRPQIKEASEFVDYNYPVLSKKMTDRRSILLVGGSLITMFGLMAGCTIKNKIDESSDTSLTSTSAIYSTTEGETSEYSSETVDTTVSTSDYSLQTLDVDYSSPTRNTNTSSGNNGGNGSGNKGTTDPTIKNVNPTHNPTDVSVVSTSTAGTTTGTTTTTAGTTTEPTQTSAIPTNSNGQKVDDNGEPVQTTYIEPTGTDPLPVEPTKVTLSDDDLTNPTTTTTTAAPTTGTTTEPTKKPTTEPTTTTTASTEPVDTTIEVPVVTVDPNDPNNVKEDCKVTNKVLSLRIR